MGLFRRKKKKVIKEETFSHSLNYEISKHDEQIQNYHRLKPRLSKFVSIYKKHFATSVHIHNEGITLHFTKKFAGDYSDGFFALADKLGLNIEPICNSTYSYSEEKAFIVRAKSK